jgi:hypothetical protein
VRDALEEHLRERPLLTLAAAVGAGFVLAQAFSSRVGRVAMIAAGGYAATRILGGEGMRVLEGLLGEDIDDEDLLEEEIGGEVRSVPPIEP